MGLVCGLIVGFIVGVIVAQDNPPNEIASDLTIQESIEVCEKLIYDEPFISLRDEVAIKNLINYAKTKINNEDDMK